MAPHSASDSCTHISDTSLPTDAHPTQSTVVPKPVPTIHLQGAEAPTTAIAPQVIMQAEDKATTEYTWPNSTEDVDMTSGDEPLHTMLLPDKDITQNPAVLKAMTSLALGRTVEQDRDDIMVGTSLPIISALLLLSLIPINKEKSLLFSSIKPLQGDALIRAAGIMKDNLPPGPSKKKMLHWSILVQVHIQNDTQSALTQEPVYSMGSPSETYEDIMFSQGLKKMGIAFPNLPEEHLTIALQRHNNDLPTAMTWLQSAVDMKDMRSTLLNAFPSAVESDIKDTMKEFKGDFVLLFNRLAASYDPTSDWDNMTYVCQQGVMDIGEDVPEFLYNNPGTKSLEIQWWRTCVAIRRHRISAYPHVDAVWSKISQIAVAPRPITPCFIKYVEDLGMKHVNHPSFLKAIRTLCAQQDFTGLLATIREPTPQSISNDNKHPEGRCPWVYF